MRGKCARRLIAIFSLLLLLGSALGIVLDGMRDDIQACDVAVVLGSKVMPDGTPSPRLQARLDRAAKLYRQGVFGRIIVSGGTGKEGFSEARVMADYLTSQQQVPSGFVILDEHGNTTQDTAVNSAALMKANGLTSALVVTQYFHITRSRYTLQRAGISPVYSAHAHYFELRDLYSTVRELGALPAYWLGFR